MGEFLTLVGYSRPVGNRLGEFLTLVGYSRPVYKKCELCSRVKDCHYRLDVRSAEAKSMLIGSLDLCKVCAQNMGEIIQK